MLKVKMVSRHRAFQPNDTYPGNTEYINVLLGEPPPRVPYWYKFGTFILRDKDKFFL